MDDFDQKKLDCIEKYQRIIKGIHQRILGFICSLDQTKLKLTSLKVSIVDFVKQQLLLTEEDNHQTQIPFLDHSLTEEVGLDQIVNDDLHMLRRLTKTFLVNQEAAETFYTNLKLRAANNAVYSKLEFIIESRPRQIAYEEKRYLNLIWLISKKISLKKDELASLDEIYDNHIKEQKLKKLNEILIIPPSVTNVVINSEMCQQNEVSRKLEVIDDGMKCICQHQKDKIHTLTSQISKLKKVQPFKAVTLEERFYFPNLKEDIILAHKKAHTTECGDIKRQIENYSLLLTSQMEITCNSSYINFPNKANSRSLFQGNHLNTEVNEVPMLDFKRICKESDAEFQMKAEIAHRHPQILKEIIIPLVTNNDLLDNQNSSLQQCLGETKNCLNIKKVQLSDLCKKFKELKSNNACLLAQITASSIKLSDLTYKIEEIKALCAEVDGISTSHSIKNEMHTSMHDKSEHLDKKTLRNSDTEDELLNCLYGIPLHEYTKLKPSVEEKSTVQDDKLSIKQL